MANNLTGDYPAVLQVSVRQLNGILASMHQKRIDPAASPSFPHRGSIRVGDLPVRFSPEILRYQSWVTDSTKAMGLAAGASISQTRQLLSGKTPPGVSSMFADAWKALDQSLIEMIPPGAARGRADFQLSTPAVSFPAGSVSEVMVHVWVRAVFHPDAGAGALPGPIHGEVQALYGVTPISLPGGRRVLRVRASADDNQVRFLSAAPLVAADAQEIARRVRTALRSDFVPVDVELDPQFAFAEFKGLGGGATAGVALPVQLSGGPAPAGGMSSVTNPFLGSSDFAIAVSKEFVQAFLDKVVVRMRQTAAGRTFSAIGATYRASVSAISITWKSGGFDISGKIDVVTSSWWAPNGWITFTQPLTVALHEPSQTVSLVALGDAQVDESWFIPHSRAANAVREARDSALPGASIDLNRSFRDAQDNLTKGLHEFDDYASVRYKAVEVTPDGIIARGEIGTSGRLAPVVHYAPIDGGAAFSAFKSWIPGGRIERYEWTWAEGDIWLSHVESVNEQHTFICKRPPGLGDANRICLRIHGSVTESSGHVSDVTAGEGCRPSWEEPILTVPPWWFEAIVPVWLPRWPELTLTEQIAGHVNVLGESREPGRLTPNTLVHFAGARMERPLEALARAVSQMRRANRSLLIVLVLPRGTFDQRRSDVEARLGSLRERFGGRLVVTEDFAGGWAKTFAAVDEVPSTHLIDARGEFVWTRDGRLDSEALARALDEHGLDGPLPRNVPLELSVEPGDAAPEAHLVDEQGNRTALRRLRGQRVLLNFWQSWSAPCLRELQRLQELQRHADAPLIFAINGGENREVIEDVRRRNTLTLSLIQDSGKRIAGRYGVRCWPTTVSVNREGIVDRIQFGLTDDLRERPRAGA